MSETAVSEMWVLTSDPAGLTAAVKTGGTMHIGPQTLTVGGHLIVGSGRAACGADPLGADDALYRVGPVIECPACGETEGTAGRAAKIPAVIAANIGRAMSG